LSFGQRRLWFLDRLSNVRTAYNTPAAFRLLGRLDLTALQKAMTLVLSRHEALRTRFGAAEGEPFQIIDDPVPFEPVVTELPQDSDPEASATDLLRADAQVPFDLATGPLFRARLIRLGPDDHVLGVLVHHTVFDRASLEVWMDEVSLAYAAATSGEVPVLPELPVQYAEFADWQREELSGDALEAHLAYWRDQLTGAPFVLELPTDRPRPQLPTGLGGFVDFEVPTATADALRNLAKTRGTTLFVVCLTAYQAVLSKHTGAEEVLVGCPAGGRTQVALERLIGFFVNSLPLRADLRGDPLIAELVDRAADALLGAHAHQAAPFDRIVEQLGPPRELGRNPLFQVWFDLVSLRSGGESGALDLAGLRVRPFDTGQVRTRFDAELHLLEHADGTLTGRVQYAEDLFDHDTFVAFAEHYRNFLLAVAEDPGLRLSEIRMFSAEELHRILEQWGTAGHRWLDT
jgi:hypothetical protein